MTQRTPSERKRRRVWCSQFASCRWKGYRTGTVTEVVKAPCPVCGKDVVR